MILSARTSVLRLARRTVSVANMVSAVGGGLSLMLAVTAPADMRTTSWGSFPDAVVVACVRGGLPFLSAGSIVLSRWVLNRRMPAVALVIAAAPLVGLVALLASRMAIAGGSGLRPLFPGL